MMRDTMKRAGFISMLMIGWVYVGGCELSPPVDNANDNDNGNANTNDNANDNSANANESASGSETHEVSMINITYEPDTLTINVGDTVRWVNNEAASITHTVTSGLDSVRDDTPMLDSGNITQGDSFEFTFTEAGDYVYFCEIHPQQMTNARIIVEDGIPG